MSNFMKIKPLDPLFFRNGKPFNMGENSWSDSNILPYPSTIWGAMFSVLFKANKVKTSEEYRRKLKIKNIYLYNEEKTTVLLPAPLDIFIDDEQNRYIGTYKDVDFISNCPYKVVLDAGNNYDMKSAENMFIEINSLYGEYANNDAKNLVLYHIDDIFAQEHKVGIKISDRKIAEEGQLYRIDMTRFLDNWSFLVEYELDKNIEFEKKGVLKFGGEAKSASYEVLQDEPISIKNANIKRDKKQQNLQENRYVKIYLKTPSFFKQGSQPPIEPLCACIGKHLKIGGFDMEKKEQKPMKKFVPAGSIFVYKKEDGEKFLTDDDENYKGFGLFEKLIV